MEEIVDFLRKCGVFYLATEEGDQPRVRPFGAVDVFEGKIYIQTGKRKNVSQQMKVDPKIEICAYMDGQWLRISAIAVDDPRSEAQAHMLDANPSLKKMYAVDDGNTQVLYLKNAVATFSSFTGAPRIKSF